MTDLGSIYGTTNVDGSNTLVIDFSNVDICGNLNVKNTRVGEQPIFGSFDISGYHFNLTTDTFTTITALKEQTGVVANGMSVDSTTGVITLNTTGTYLLNAGFAIGQQAGGGGLNYADLQVCLTNNNVIKTIATWWDNWTSPTGDGWRNITLSGHVVIVADTADYQIIIRARGSTNGSLTSVRSGTGSSGVSILKIV